MKTINLFNQLLEYKDYDCSRSPHHFAPRPPMFNLYIQVTDVCNAKCQFCDKANCIPKDKQLDIDKLSRILRDLTNYNILKRISLTGGEPLLKTDKLNQILDVIYTVNPKAYVSLNTNGSCLENFDKVKRLNFIQEIDMSHHHYDTMKNDKAFGIRVAQFKDIREFSKHYKTVNLKLNCVMTNNRIHSVEDVKTYLETVAQYGIKEVRFISLLDLTPEYNRLCFDVDSIVKHFEKHHTQIGNLYDKDICQCFGFMYVASNGFPVTAFIRNTKKAKCHYLRQFVYTPDNRLLNGFNGQIII